MLRVTRTLSDSGTPSWGQEEVASSAQDAQTRPLAFPHVDDSDDLSYEDSGDEASPASQDNDINERGSKEPENSGDESPSSPSENGSPERPNRFDGSRDKWLRWTQRERQEVAALDTIRARDLSLHLYNAFALKRRAEILKKQRSQDVEAAEKSDKGQILPHEDLSSTFAPNRGWTAWPMPADIVPRTTEKVTKDHYDDWTIRTGPDARPSAELEECLMAQMMKSAAQRFEAREYQPDQPRKYTRKPGSDTEAMASGKEDDEARTANSVRRFRPVVQADDEESKRIMRPEARHIISKFDELLLNLYHARHSYLTAADLSQPEDEDNDDDEGDDDGETNASASTPRRKRKRTRTASRPSSSRSNASTNDDRPSNPTSSPFRDDRKRPKRSVPHIARLGLRDWSDVLGVASMAGWPNAAVMRASRRCADLFGQDMIFHTLDEGKVQLEKDEDGSAIWKYVENEEDEEVTMTDAGLPVPAYIDKPKEYALFCPVEECKRHTQGFSRNWNLEQHLQTKHPTLAARSGLQTED